MESLQYSALPLVVSFILTAAIMPRLIAYFRREQLGQTTREEGPSWHAEKSGTPTMGGVAIILVVTAVTLAGMILLKSTRMYLAILLMTFLFFGMIGFVDDYIILIKKQNEGLTSKQKFIAQIVGGVLLYIFLLVVRHPLTLYLPIIPDLRLGWLYGFFCVFWVVGFSNATNLTDGIDGLMATVGTISYLTYSMIAAVHGRYEILLFTLSVAGSLIGFYLFNKKPAQIFMGDVGSLALGAGLAAVSMLLHVEWTLLLIGFVYVLETASVMMQVAYFKKTGRRIFKMTPIHHHFEMSGWDERQIVRRFGLLSLALSVLVLMLVL